MIKRILATLAVAVTLLGLGVSSPASAVVSAKPKVVYGKPIVHPFSASALAKAKANASASGVTTLVSGPPYYWYAGGIQGSLTASSLSANLTVDNPYADPWANDHSVTELAVIRNDGSGTTRQIVEVGLGVNTQGNGDDDTLLWTFAWKNGVPLGWGTSGTGFVNYCSNSPCTHKQNLDVLVAGPGGTSLSGKAFVIEHQSSPSAGWWVGYDGQWFGYWPDSVWSGVSPSFTSGDEVQVFGEVASPYNDNSCTDMGNENYPPAGAATFASTSVNGSGTGVSLSKNVTDPTFYDAAYISTSVRSMYYGGTGYSGC